MNNMTDHWPQRQAKYVYSIWFLLECYVVRDPAFRSRKNVMISPLVVPCTVMQFLRMKIHSSTFFFLQSLQSFAES